MVSGIPPRYGTNVQPLNMILEDLCDNNNLQFIDHTKVFNDRHGYAKQQLFHPDGIHLSKKGTSTFLHNIYTCATIMQQRETKTWYCFIVVKMDITNKHVDIHRQSCVIRVVNMGIKKYVVSFIHVRRMAKMTKP